MSLIGQTPKQKTTVENYPVVFSPITEFKTVKECLCQAESATLEVGQQYVIKTLVKEEVIEGMEAFTCAVYNRSRLTKVDELRRQLLKDKCRHEVINANQEVDLATLPPCRRSLVQHIRR